MGCGNVWRISILAGSGLRNRPKSLSKNPWGFSAAAAIEAGAERGAAGAGAAIGTGAAEIGAG